MWSSILSTNSRGSMVVGHKTILKLSCSGPFGLGQEIPQLDPRSGPTRLWLYMGMGELEMNKNTSNAYSDSSDSWLQRDVWFTNVQDTAPFVETAVVARECRNWMVMVVGKVEAPEIGASEKLGCRIRETSRLWRMRRRRRG